MVLALVTVLEILWICHFEQWAKKTGSETSVLGLYVIIWRTWHFLQYHLPMMQQRLSCCQSDPHHPKYENAKLLFFGPEIKNTNSE